MGDEWHKEGQKTRYISVKPKKAWEEKAALVVPMEGKRGQKKREKGDILLNISRTDILKEGV
ncbi:MAG: hypothetical protein IKX58_07160 [Clostridia bacterium]|nr:hypothetical protein [Clostridia bacterium]